MQKTEKVKLENGLEIYFLIDKRFTTSSVQMLFKVGWRNDPEKYLGLAHLFEHLVGKRTKKFPGKSEFTKKLEDTGIFSNAWTGPDSTTYWHSQTHENLIKSLGYLCEAIYQSNFLEEDMEKEKQVVLTESRRHLDNDSSVLWQKTIQSLYPGTTLEKFFFGNEVTLGSITPTVFEEYYKIYNNPSNSVLFVGTDSGKTKKKVTEFLNDFYKKNNKKLRISNAKIEKFLDKKTEVKKFLKVEKKEKTQSEIRVAFRFDQKLNTKERMAFGVLRQILVGGFSGKLVKILRDEMGLVYNIDLWWDEHAQGVQYVSFDTECAKDKKDTVIKIIQDVLPELQNHITDKDVQNVIPGSIYKTKRPVSVSSDLGELMNSVVYNYEYIQTQKGLSVLKKLKSKDLLNLAKKMFNKENMSVIVME